MPVPAGIVGDAAMAAIVACGAGLNTKRARLRGAADAASGCAFII
jgi:hypothetical protein